MNNPINYSFDFSGKFIYIRHGQTLCNADKSYLKINPIHVDSRLSEKGTKQAEKLREEIKKIKIEKVYSSPLYRALQTSEIILSEHPDSDKIIIEVNPLIMETPNCIDDLILDIKETKKDFNKNSKIKVDWNFFDNFIKNIEWEENFFYFNYFNCLDEKLKKDIYLNLKEIYNNKKDMELFKNEIAILPKIMYERNIMNESYKHCYQRFLEFREYIFEQNKESIKDINKKILLIGHGDFIRVITSKKLYENDDIQKICNEHCSLKNCEVISLFL